jgi:hypothetical protein
LKKLLLIALIASQLVWNISDTLVRESWLTEEQSEQDFSKENSKKEKEIRFESFFRSELRSISLHFQHFVITTQRYADLHRAKAPYLSISYLKVPLYLLQSCIRI